MKLIDYLKLGPAFSYFGRVFKKDTEGKFPTSTNLKMMHGINRISIVMFIICLFILAYKFIIRE